MHSVRQLSATALFVLSAACSLSPTPPPSIPIEAYGGMGDRMAQCMQFASESYCEQQVWGGGER